LLRAQTETGTNNVLSFDGHTWDHGGPNIRVDYEWHPGIESDQTYEQVAVDGTSKIAINAATGNVAVDSTDVSLPGVGGLDLKIRRTFNGQNLGSGGGMFGSAWSDGINNAAFLNDRVWWDDSRTIYANGNAIYRFDRDPVHDTSTTHAYLSPPNINADLVSNISTGVATLTFRDTGIKWTYRASFDGNNVTLAQISDPAGHHIDITPKSGQPEKIGSITDTNGAVLTFVYGTNDQLTKITKGATEWKYTTTIVNSHNLLTGYTNPTNQTTSYHYDASALPDTWDKLDRVTDQAGQIFKLTYGPQDWSQVTQITQDFPDSRPDNITKFNYTPISTLGHACTTPVANSPYPNNVVFDRTVETDNAGRATTYCYNTSGQVIQSWRPWDTTPPTITGVPNPFVFQDGYTNGVTPFVVGLSADDTPSGVKRVALEEVGHGELTSATSPCPPTTTMPDLCPASFSSPVTINPAPLSAGAHVIRQTATDLAGNVAASATWAIKVDRTAPGAATSFSATYDPVQSTTTVNWDDPIDPVLPGGGQPSGTTLYQYRVQRGSGAWSAWQTATESAFPLTSSFAGEGLNVQIQAIDAVGNAGPIAAATLTATAVPADTAPPTLTLTGTEAAYDAGSGKTIIDWSSADDPDLSDGSPSAGVGGYNVRWRLDGGPWTVPVATESPRFLLTGGHVGQTIALEISAFDLAGNTGAVQSASVTSTTFQPGTGGNTPACSPTDDGLPPDCVDGDGDGDFGNTAMLFPLTGSSLTTARATGLDRARISVDGLWTTARLRAGSYVTGNVRDGWTIDLVGQQILGYAFGEIRGAFQGCGWILATLKGAPYAHDGESDCQNQGAEDGGGGPRKPPLSSIAVGVNPLPADGSPVKLKSNQVNGVKFCAYIVPSPLTVQKRHTCGGVFKKVTYAQLSDSDGYKVAWRYVVRGGGWVLLHDINAGINNGDPGYGTINWWFVRRSALGVLCKRGFQGIPGASACAPDN
jgi:YD repeat-containing protein